MPMDRFLAIARILLPPGQILLVQMSRGHVFLYCGRSPFFRSRRQIIYTINIPPLERNDARGNAGQPRAGIWTGDRG